MAIPKLDELLTSIVDIFELSVDFQRRATVSYQRKYILGLCINIEANWLFTRSGHTKVRIAKGRVYPTCKGAGGIGANRSGIGTRTVIWIDAGRAFVDVLTRVIDDRVSAQALANVVDATSPDTLRICVAVVGPGAWIGIVSCLSGYVGD